MVQYKSISITLGGVARMELSVSDKELFEQVFNECSAIATDFDEEQFIRNCESTYKMTSSEFKAYFEEKEYEGNVDMQIWYQILKVREEEL